MADPFFAGINFVRPGATYIGSGVDTQRSLTVLGNAGNNAQILLGGANAGVPLTHKGTPTPQILGMGSNPCLFQALDASASGTGLSFHARTDDADKSHLLLMNGYFLPTGVLPMQADKMVWLVEFGGSQGFRIKGSTGGFCSEVPLNLFVDFGGLKVAPQGGYRSEATFPAAGKKRTSDFPVRRLLARTIYYDTTATTLRVNTGGTTWADLN